MVMSRSNPQDWQRIVCVTSGWVGEEVRSVLGDWFRSYELRVTFHEFECMPRHPAYKYEYYGGRAVITPWPRYQRAVLELTSFPPPASPSGDLSGAHVRPLEPADWGLLPSLLAAAFHGLPPFATLSDELRLSAAADCVEHTRTGGDGPLIESACLIAVGSGQEKGLAGAILITRTQPPGTESAGTRPGTIEQPHLTWVMVRPWHFRQGLGTALLGRAGAVLRELGYRELASTFVVGNDRSTLWHWRNGFRLLPDPWSLRLGRALA